MCPNTSFSVGWKPLANKDESANEDDSILTIRLTRTIDESANEDGSILTVRLTQNRSQSLQVRTIQFRLLKDAFSRLLESAACNVKHGKSAGKDGSIPTT